MKRQTTKLFGWGRTMRSIMPRWDEKKLCEVQQMFFKKKTIFLKSFLKWLEQERAPKGVNFFLSSDCWSVAPLLKTKLGTGIRCFSNSRKVYTSSFSLKSCLKRLQTRCAFALDQPMTSHWAPSRNVWMWTTCALEVRNFCKLATRAHVTVRCYVTQAIKRRPNIIQANRHSSISAKIVLNNQLAVSTDALSAGGHCTTCSSKMWKWRVPTMWSADY